MKPGKQKLVRRNPFVSLAIKRKAGKHKKTKQHAFAKFVRTGCIT